MPMGRLAREKLELEGMGCQDRSGGIGDSVSVVLCASQQMESLGRTQYQL